MISNTEQFTTVRSLLEALAKAMNLINSSVSHHHEQTAYLACLIAREMGMNTEEIRHTIYASLLYDVGTVMREKQMSLLEVERESKIVSMAGAIFLYGLEGFDVIGDIIAHCQMNCEELDIILQGDPDKLSVLRSASVVHLADKVSLMLRENVHVLNQAPHVRKIVEEEKGKAFYPDAADAFLRISDLEQVWLDVLYNPTIPSLGEGVEGRYISLEKAIPLTQLMSRIIDYRSPFTKMHSAGVAASARKLAELVGMSKKECQMMEIAGNLHDVGKLVVPKSILEKPGKLTDEEFNIIKEHPYYTRMILSEVEGFDLITEWAGNHHEKLNGRGYPRHLSADDLDIGARIMAVADIFSAITEDRPYRKGMDRDMAMKVMKENVEFGAISGEMVTLLHDHYDEIDEARAAMSKEEGRRYYASLEQESEK